GRLDSFIYCSSSADLLPRKSASGPFGQKSVNLIPIAGPLPIHFLSFVPRKLCRHLIALHYFSTIRRFSNTATESNAFAGNKLAYSLHSPLLGLVEVASLSTLPPPSREGST